MDKKASLQMMENAITVFFFIMLLALALIFGYSFYGKYQENKIFELRLEESANIAELLTSMPELACSQSGNFEKDCIDLDKIALLDQNKEYFFDYLGYSTISLHKLYPPGNAFTIYDNVPEGYNNVYSTVFPVQVYNATDELSDGGKNYFSYLQVKMYYD